MFDRGCDLLSGVFMKYEHILFFVCVCMCMHACVCMCVCVCVCVMCVSLKECTLSEEGRTFFI